jgi:hypothetical protein
MKRNLKSHQKSCLNKCNLHIGGSGNDIPEELQDPDEVKPIIKEIQVNEIIDKTEEPPVDNQNQDHQETQHNDIQITEPVITPIPWMDVSKVSLYTIPQGTILYHGSQSVDTFNIKTLKLNINTNVAFFSPNIEIAKSYIQDCSPTNPSGFVHKFKVNVPVDNIYIISASETSNIWQERIIEEKFCNNSNNDSCYSNLHGIGFFIKTSDVYNSEFALCKPLDFLEYQGRAHCNGARILSDDFEKF